MLFVCNWMLVGFRAWVISYEQYFNYFEFQFTTDTPPSAFMINIVSILNCQSTLDTPPQLSALQIHTSSSNFIIWFICFSLRLTKMTPLLFEKSLGAVGELFGYVRKKQPWADTKIVKVSIVTSFTPPFYYFSSFKWPEPAKIKIKTFIYFNFSFLIVSLVDISKLLMQNYMDFLVKELRQMMRSPLKKRKISLSKMR